jgi:hypothetical protein
LEPSPPAVDHGDQFADDPALRGEVAAGRMVVGPTPDADVQWADLAGADPDMANWCAARWLGPWPDLAPFPASLATTRESLRAVACYVLAPARKTITGRIGLRYTRGGFGTPFFGHDWQLRVVGEVLVVQVGTTARTAPLVTVRDAARAASVQLVADPGVGAELPILEPDRPLEIDAAACFALGEWYGFGASVETLRAQLRPLGEVSRVQLWPEHLDIAFSYRPPDGPGLNLGLSPGDARHRDPYLYVGPREATELHGPFWNAPFGALLDSGALRIDETNEPLPSTF